MKRTTSEPTATIPRIPYTSITPSQFFASYISKRQPCIITGVETSADFKDLFSRWSKPHYSHFLEKAGDCEVSVEQKIDGYFGKGVEKKMKLKQVLTQLDKGNTDLYLSTQPLSCDYEDRPDVVGPPLHLLSNDFPVVPAIAGNLIPASVNVWIGNAGDSGAASGLHHDYHDNFYVLVDGKKHFTLFSYEDIDKMYTRGTVGGVHKNGRVWYDTPVRADGAPLNAEQVVAAHEAREKAELRLEKAQKSNNPDEIDEAERELDEALEKMLAIEKVDYDNERDDYEEDDDEIGEELFAKLRNMRDDYQEDDDDCEGVEELLRKIEPKNKIVTGKGKGTVAGEVEGQKKKKNRKKRKRRRKDPETEKAKNLKKQNNNNNKIQKDNKKQEEKQEEQQSQKISKCGGTTTSCGGQSEDMPPAPPSFSRISDDATCDLHFLRHVNPKKFPEFSKATRYELEITSKEMLYLPSGWFHNVTSVGKTVALNYWFFPPDNVGNGNSNVSSGNSAAGFKKPYLSKFWEIIWQEHSQNKNRQ